MNEISPDHISAFARELLNSRTAGGMILPLPSSRDPAFDLDTAYAVEAEIVRLRAGSGYKRVGRKVGYANKAMWRALKLETLVWASMYDDTVLTAASELSLAHCVSPKIEPEIVFKLKRPIGKEDLIGPAILEAVEWLALGFEVIDCPFADWQFKAIDFVAAYGLHKALIIGQPCYVEPPMIRDLFNNLAAFELKLLKNGQLMEEGSGKNSLRNPALCLAELADAVHRRTGSSLQLGEIVSTGTLTAALPVAMGDTWQAEVEGLPVANLAYHNLVGGS
jgi:2-oxo-3-hexenedioate decarboxylase